MVHPKYIRLIFTGICGCTGVHPYKIIAKY